MSQKRYLTRHFYVTILYMLSSLTTHQKFIAAFTAAYILWFGFQFIQALNYEFIAYIVLEVAIFAVLFGTLHITKFPTYILWGLSAWGLMHMIGGGVIVNGEVFYAYRMYPFFDGGGEFYILKFDQFVHAFLYGVVSLMFLHLFREFLSIKKHALLISVIAIMAALGVSALNEIVEFSAVVLLPETGVGGYINTLLDIIFNLGGAIIAVIGFYIIQKLREK